MGPGWSAMWESGGIGEVESQRKAIKSGPHCQRYLNKTRAAEVGRG